MGTFQIGECHMQFTRPA